MAEATVHRLQVEHLRHALGIGLPTPRLSWQIATDLPNWRQTAYEIALLDGEGHRREQTGRLPSDQSVLVAWPFAPLRSREQVGVQVRVWGPEESASPWSEPLPVEAGLLHPTDWQASFISPTWEEDTSTETPAPYLRREFQLSGEVRSARLYITALGVYEAELNGQPVDDQVLAPGWTPYNQRLRYQTWDVTPLLRPGRNALGAIVADGWYRGRLGFGGGRRNIYGDRPALLAQLEIRYVDGSQEVIGTDGQWRAATGAVLASSIYDGETYDARLEPLGWSTPGFDDGGWTPVQSLDQDLGILQAPLGPPVRRIEVRKPVAVTHSPSGKTLIDFGQNVVGWLAIEVQGPAGQTVTLRHAEVLEHGELGTRPLRRAQATDRYTLRGGGVERWQPRFTFHGFRYAEVTGWPGELAPDAVQAVVVHSDLERIGKFECSHPLLNQLHQNVVWGMRGNFLDVPTDCPQRDERMGWTGDIQVFAPTASFLYDVSGFLQSWLVDLAIEQGKRDGSVPHVVPDILDGNGAAAWGDAAVVVPWVLYQRYGDPAILEAQFDSMCAWVDHVASLAGENFLWDSGFQFGDWLDPSAPPDNPFMARTDGAIVASAYFAHSAERVTQAAALLGRQEEQDRYGAIARRAKAAFMREYVTPAGRLMNDAETAYSLALMFDLLETDEQRQRAGDRLAALVLESGYRIRTGFVGTPLICDALTKTGHLRAAYRLLRQEECPSWLYPVTMGATTIWERWDSMLPDGTINPGEMTSFNHYALGAVADWMHRTIGGLTPTQPGYRQMAVAPRPGGGLTHCHIRLQTPYGPAECEWQIGDGTIHMDVTVPPNAQALVTVPGTDLEPAPVGSGHWHWSAPYTDPDARGPFTVDDPVGEIITNRASRERVLEALEQVGAPRFLTNVIQNRRNAPLRALLERLPNAEEAMQTMNEILAQIDP